MTFDARGAMRIEPAMPIGNYKTYRCAAPKGSHLRKATCAEVECGAYLRGWVSTLDISTKLGERAAYYIEREAGRRYTVDSDVALPMRRYIFEPGQEAFPGNSEHDHWEPLERPPILLARDGDWRGNPTGRKTRHTTVDSWLDDYMTNADRVNRIIGS